MSRDTYITEQFLPPNYRTMQDIADELGVSKQRVQQILKRNSVHSSDGGSIAKNSYIRQQKEKQKKIKRKQSVFSQYGCSESEALRINEGKKLAERGSPSYKYKSYKNNLDKKDIGCELTFPEWYDIWQKSGKYSLMRPGKGGYSMVRKDYSKPASVDNVEVIPSHHIRRR